MKVLFAASECVPFVKTGGLADVVGALPKRLRDQGADVRVMLPMYSAIEPRWREKMEHVLFFYVNLGWRRQYVGIEKLVYDGITFYFVDNEQYFGRNYIYGYGADEGERFAYFCRAVLESLPLIDFVPDILHCHDWQTGLIPPMLDIQYRKLELYKNIKTVFTIHNMMYQGTYAFGAVRDWLGVDPSYYNSECLEAYGCANFMKAALVFADKINTVSPTYAEEIKTAYYAYGMEGILNARSADLCGILNGIDVDAFDPETDKYLKYHFSLSDMNGKYENKKMLMRELGLTADPSTPLIGMISRLTSQKGFDLVMRVFNEIMQENVAIVLLGTGDPMYESFFRGMEASYKGRVCSYIAYDNALSHQIYAASDLFLMPSKFEPCGISQMISLRYGTLPIVRETGGLRDTVVPYNEYTGEGNGFSFTNYNAHDMLEVIRLALRTIGDPATRRRLIEHAMTADNSFIVSAKKYRDLYLSLLD